MLNITVDDFQYKVRKGLTLIQACLAGGVDIPRFCFHEGLSIAGNCRICLVEDVRQIKPLIACATNLANNVVFYTNTVKVKKARESVLEFLLANHPLDCPICDQGGECDLQDQSLVFGADRGRFYEFKRSVEDKDCGPLVKTIMNRCIHCTRCVRFVQEVAGLTVLGVTGRGSKMEIGFYIESLLNSELSGNVIDLCPVGALTSIPFAFTARPWELKSVYSIDVTELFHSNIRIDMRGTKVMRILPRVGGADNPMWINDKIRFGFDGFLRQRTYSPMMGSGNGFIKSGWRKALNFFKVAICFSPCHVPYQVYIGEFLDLKMLFLLKRFYSIFGSTFYLKNILPNSILESGYGFGVKLEHFYSTDFVLIYNLGLRLVSPVLNSVITTVARRKNICVYVVGCFSNFTYFIKHISVDPTAVLSLVEGTHWLNTKFNSVQKPIVLLNENEPLANFFSEFYKKFHYQSSWQGVNFVSKFGSSSNSLVEVGLVSDLFKPVVNTIGLFYNALLDLQFQKQKFLYTFYTGSYFVETSCVNLVLPTSSFLEKEGLYLNSWNSIKEGKVVLKRFGDSRDDWTIVNAVLAEFGDLHFRNLSDLFKSFSRLSGVLDFDRNSSSIRYNYSRSSTNFFSGFIFNTIYRSFINNFWNSDFVSKNSKIMSLCNLRYQLESYNFFK